MKPELKMMCPVCNAEMSVMAGESLHPGDTKHGTTVYCPNRDCSAQEVSGHGDNVKEAFDVVQHKFKA